MKNFVFSSIFIFINTATFAGNDFACNKMDNQRLLAYSAIYGAFYSLGYNDARDKKLDKEFNKFRKKILEYIKVGCKNEPNSNIVNLFRKGIKSGYATSDHSKRNLKQPKFDIILYKLSGGADRDTRECLKINLTEDLVKIVESKFDELEKVCGNNCKRYNRNDLRKIFNKRDGKVFDKEFKLAFKKCKL